MRKPRTSAAIWRRGKLGTGLFLGQHRQTGRDLQPGRKTNPLAGETVRQHLKIPRVARASCPRFRDTGHGRDAHATRRTSPPAAAGKQEKASLRGQPAAVRTTHLRVK